MVWDVAPAAALVPGMSSSLMAGKTFYPDKGLPSLAKSCLTMIGE
jgi:hypothetical protein